jgi:hypothetical protein
MAQSTNTTLKTYFNAGDEPTEAQFVDLIDSATIGTLYSNQGAQSSAYTTLLTDSGRRILVTGTTTITLLTAQAGVSFYIINGNNDGTAITVTPDTGDNFIMLPSGVAGSNGTPFINTAATAEKGDFIHIVYGGANEWTILELGGIWAE